MSLVPIRDLERGPQWNVEMARPFRPVGVDSARGAVIVEIEEPNAPKDNRRYRWSFCAFEVGALPTDPRRRTFLGSLNTRSAIQGAPPRTFVVYSLGEMFETVTEEGKVAA